MNRLTPLVADYISVLCCDGQELSPPPAGDENNAPATYSPAAAKHQASHLCRLGVVERGEIGVDEICTGVCDSHMPKPEFASSASYVFLGIGRAGYCRKELIGDWQERFSKPSIRGGLH